MRIYYYVIKTDISNDFGKDKLHSIVLGQYLIWGGKCRFQ